MARKKKQPSESRFSRIKHHCQQIPLNRYLSTAMKATSQSDLIPRCFSNLLIFANTTLKMNVLSCTTALSRRAIKFFALFVLLERVLA